MKTLRVALLTALAVGCHFDKLFNAAGGGQEPPGGGPPATHLVFATQPSNSSAGSTISPPVRVAALDAQGDTVTTFSGRVSIAIGQNGGVLGGAHLSGTTDVDLVNGIATFGDLSIDQPGVSSYTLEALNTPLGNVESATFAVGP